MAHQALIGGFQLTLRRKYDVEYDFNCESTYGWQVTLRMAESNVEYDFNDKSNFSWRDNTICAMLLFFL